MAEIRTEVPNDELLVLDGFCAATGKNRTDILRMLLATWTKEKLHESIIVCRMARINPLASEVDR